MSLIALFADAAQAQQKIGISLSQHPDIFYMPTHIIEKKLMEKRGAALDDGVDHVQRLRARTDAFLAGGVDVLNTGSGNLLLLWGRTQGDVRAPSRHNIWTSQ